MAVVAFKGTVSGICRKPTLVSCSQIKISFFQVEEVSLRGGGGESETITITCFRTEDR